MSKSISSLPNGAKADTEEGDYICKLFFLIFFFFSLKKTF